MVVNGLHPVVIAFADVRVYKSTVHLIKRTYLWYKEFKWKLFFRNAFEALGSLSAIATLIAFMCKWPTDKLTLTHSLVIATLIITATLIYTYCQMRTSKLIELRFHKYKVTIEEGDLFRSNGVIVIPVNEYFDTQVDDHIIDHDTIHGMFVDRYVSKFGKQALDNAIATGLSAYKGSENKTRTEGKIRKYPLGTCVDIEFEGNTFVLFALTKFDKEHHAYLGSDKLHNIVYKLLTHLSTLNLNMPIFMPVFGIGKARLGRTTQRMLLFLLDCIEFVTDDNMNFQKGITFKIFDLESANVNLDDIKTVFNSNLY